MNQIQHIFMDQVSYGQSLSIDAQTVHSIGPVHTCNARMCFTRHGTMIILISTVPYHVHVCHNILCIKVHYESELMS